MPPNRDIAPYVEAAAKSSDRGRFVLIVMVIASVLAFSALWNSRQGAWNNLRVIRVREAIAYLTAKAANSPDTLRFEAGKGLVTDRQLLPSDTAVLRAEAEALARARVEQVLTIHVPFLGIVFDVNDLGLLSGFAFTVILMWLTFSLNREQGNLKVAFDNSRESGQLRQCYDLLLMRQVLTVPQHLEGPGRLAWGLMPRILFVLPFGVQAAIAIHDVATWTTGAAVSSGGALAVMVLGMTFCVLVLVFTITSLYCSSRIDQTWKKAATEIAGSHG